MSKLEPDSSSKQANNSSSATESLKKSVKGAPQSSNDPLYSRLNEYEFTRDKANSNVRHLLEKYKRRCPQCTEIQIYYVLKKNDFNEKVCDTHFDSISRRVKTDRFKNSATGNKLFLHQLPEVQHESSNKDTDRETLNADVSAQLDEDIGIYGTGKLRRRRLIKIKDDVKYLDEVHFNDPAGKRRNFSGLQFNRYRGFAKKTANPSYREDNLSNEPATGNMHRNHNNNNNNNGNLMMAGADSKGAAVDSKTTDEESLRDSDYKFSMYKKRHAPLQLQAQRNPGFKGLKYAQDLAGFDPDYSSPTILTEKHCAFRVNKRFFDSEWNNSSNVSDGQLPKKGPGGKRKVEKESNKFIRALSKGFASEIDYYIVESFDEIRDEDDSNKGAMTWEYSRTSRDTDFKKSTTNNKGKDDLDLSEILREVTLNDNKTDDQEIKTMSANDAGGVESLSSNKSNTDSTQYPVILYPDGTKIPLIPVYMPQNLGGEQAGLVANAGSNLIQPATIYIAGNNHNLPTNASGQCFIPQIYIPLANNNNATNPGNNAFPPNATINATPTTTTISPHTKFQE